MKISILSLFPEVLAPYLNASILGRAQAKGLLEINLVNPRNYTENKHNKVDDTPYGGGSGMVLACQPIMDAYKSLGSLPKNTPTLITSPAGKPFNQTRAKKLALQSHLVLLCGHYEGFDERLTHLLPNVELVSIGDFVLTGGELPALCIVDAVARMLPEVVQAQDSVIADSFYNGLLDHPHYTKPASFSGLNVPEVLLSGNHPEIARWRRMQALWQTYKHRPDLLTEEAQATLSKLDKQFLEAFAQGQTPESLWQATH